VGSGSRGPGDGMGSYPASISPPPRPGSVRATHRTNALSLLACIRASIPRLAPWRTTCMRRSTSKEEIETLAR
jgi:hypothetical protein